MDPTRFDAFARVLGDDAEDAPSRRSLLAVLSGGLVAAVLTPAFAAAARRKNKRGNNGKGRKCKGKNKNKKKCAGGDGGLDLRELCEPGSDTCQSGLTCDAPTAFHQCSSTVDGIDAWCCVPPGGACSRANDECDCCGDYYCEYDENNETYCVPIE